jgi:hypothetical protein
VEAALWDLLKIAALLTDRPDIDGFVLGAATPRRWQRAEVADLFTEPGPRTWQAAGLLARWDASWQWLLAGGRARPQTLPARLRTQLHAAAPTARIPGYELRCLQLWPLADAPPLHLHDGHPTERADP